MDMGFIKTEEHDDSSSGSNTTYINNTLQLQLITSQIEGIVLLAMQWNVNKTWLPPEMS